MCKKVAHTNTGYRPIWHCQNYVPENKSTVSKILFNSLKLRKIQYLVNFYDNGYKFGPITVVQSISRTTTNNFGKLRLVP